jgi:lipopolysaccharide export system protein LptA
LLKRLHYNKRAGEYARILIVAPVLVFVFFTFNTDAVENENITALQKDDQEIHIKADKLVADIKANSAEFSGNVRVTLGNTVLTADILNIYYRQLSKHQDGKIIDKSSIKKIKAQGKVKIDFGDAVASAEVAEYFADNDELTLSGRNSTVVRGNNAVSGSKLTYYRTEGSVRVDSDDSERVKAVFSSDRKFFE